MSINKPPMTKNITNSSTLAAAVAASVLAGCSLGVGTSDGGSSASSRPVACAQLGSIEAMAGITIDKVELRPAGFVPPGGGTPASQEFCRVQATARPSPDSDIKFEVWMPSAGRWNGRFLAAGGGGNSGTIQYGRLVDGLDRGYATLSTDNGHVSKGNIHEQSWAIGHPEKVVDFGHRAQAVTAVAGKDLVRAIYGKPATKSYWIGCSQGGGKGLMQAQRYPENFDGIVVGAPVFDWVGSMFSPAWVSVKGMSDPKQLVPRSKLPMIHQAVLDSCDAQDGLVDGLLQEPGKCKPNLKALACPAGTDGPQCLTPGQVSSMERFYAPITRPDGTSVFPGYPPGSEITSAWLGQTAPGDSSWSGLWSGPVYESESYDIVARLDVDGLADFDFAKKKLSAIYDAVDPNLERFASRNGKVILWQGMNDQLTSQLRTQEYVDSVSRKMGPNRTGAFMRAYFPPGVNHCRGGSGPIPDEYDMLSKVVNWVENGEAPGAFLGTHRTASGTADRTMPICPYPQVARYDGKGNPNQASSFACKP
jgi:feruloyl esterase